MKYLILFLMSSSVFSQAIVNTEIFLFDITLDDGLLKLENGKNVSQNEGYTNQPSFYSNEILIYSKTRDEQTDINGYDIAKDENFWISNTTMGSEYSPLRIPGTGEIAAVRLDTTGLQRLYKYDWNPGEPTFIHENLKIGYFAFFNDNNILATVLTGTGMNLVLLNLEDLTIKNIVGGTGRSLHKVPGTASMSYTLINHQGEVELYLLENIEGEPESVYLTNLPPGVQDYVWLDKNRLLAGQGNKVLLYDIWGESKWTQIADLSEYNLQNITRLAINPSGDKIALAADVILE